MPPAPAPDEGMAMDVPGGPSRHHRLADFLPGVEAPDFQGQGAPDFPPWLDEMQIRGVLGLEDELPAGMDQTEQQHSRGAMDAQGIEDRGWYG